MVKDKIDAYFECRKDEIVENIKKLIAIKSVRDEALPDLPFGKGPANALKLALQMAEGLGFQCRNYENYVGTVNINDKETALGILAHLDVVPEGANWTTDPYEGAVKEGKLYGRGSSDDKGPAIAALYAMACVKEMGIALKSNVRLILGTDEETDTKDIEYYFSKESPPPCVFSPDGKFPVVNTEKGRLATSFEASFTESVQLPRIVSAKGGYRSNVVPPDAEAVIEGVGRHELEGYCTVMAQQTDVSFEVSEECEERIKVSVHGAGAHASTPEKGKNAITALISLLATMPFADCEGLNVIKAVNRIFPHGDYHGEAAGLKMLDDISGDLTLSFNLFEYTPTRIYGFFDSRIPLCATEENTMNVLCHKFKESGLTLKRAGFSRAHHTPEDSPFVKTLLSAYQQYTGQEGYCMLTGGQTYVHDIEGGVCFGATMPGVDTGIHGADEFAVIDDLITAAKIYAQVIIDLCTQVSE